MKKISDWVAGATLFMRYFSYICVWFAFVMALMSFDIQTHGVGWVVYVIGVVYISTYMTIRVAKTANKIFGPVTGTEQRKLSHR